MADTRDFNLILDARIPIIVIESFDEPRVQALLLNAAITRRMAYHEWTATRGLRLGGMDAASGSETSCLDPADVLKHIAGTPGPAIYALCDFHPYLDKEPVNVRYLKDIAQNIDHLGNVVVLVSHALEIPPELGRFTASFSLRLPSDDELMAMVRKQAQAWSTRNNGQRVRTDSETLRKTHRQPAWSLARRSAAAPRLRCALQQVFSANRNGTCAVHCDRRS